MNRRFLLAFGVSIFIHLLFFIYFYKISFFNEIFTGEEESQRTVSLVYEMEKPKQKSKPKLPPILKKQKIITRKKEINKKKETINVPKVISVPKEAPAILPDKEKLKINKVITTVNITDKNASTNEKTEIATKNIPVNIFPSPNIQLFGPIRNRNILYSAVPKYPEWAKRRGIETSVKIKFLVNNQGYVYNISIIKKSGYLRLDLLAKEALKKWKFTPIADVKDLGEQWGEIIIYYILY